MSVSKILNSLGDSWERNDVLLKLRNGLGTDEIVNEFLKDNEAQIRQLRRLLKPDDIDLFNKVEKLSTCEAKLINKITNLNYIKFYENQSKITQKKILSSKRITTNSFSLFMINWSNKVVIITLLTISAIALSKQAWA